MVSMVTEHATELTGPERAELVGQLRNVRDYPQLGSLYTDLSGLFVRPSILGKFVTAVTGAFRGRVDVVVAVESMGFLLGGAVAHALSVPLAFTRKGAKRLPGSRSRWLANAYKQEEIALVEAVIPRGARVLIVDDVTGSGATLRALAELVIELGAEIAGVAHLVDLAFIERAPSPLLATAPTVALVRLTRSEFDSIPVVASDVRASSALRRRIADRLVWVASKLR
jgi:adenine phosphoribosyltransferase